MAVTNLTGTIWEISDSPNGRSNNDDFYIDFLSGGGSFTIINLWFEIYLYNGTAVAEYNSWFDQKWRTIEITGGDDVTNTELITWLENNATLTYQAPLGYEVTFVTNGGTSVTKLEGVEELPTSLPTTTKANNIFVGWFYDSGFEEQAFSGDTISSNITLYAKWYANMSDFYEDVADTIRSKNGETNPIKHTDFAYKIKNIQGAKELTQAQYDALNELVWGLPSEVTGFVNPVGFNPIGTSCSIEGNKMTVAGTDIGMPDGTYELTCYLRPVYDNNTYYLIVEE